VRLPMLVRQRGDYTAGTLPMEVVWLIIDALLRLHTASGLFFLWLSGLLPQTWNFCPFIYSGMASTQPFFHSFSQQTVEFGAIGKQQK
jgi:hypothetical protein